MANFNRDIIVNCLEISRLSKVPMLFIANPGKAKTTVTKEWAAINNYHTEVLIGSKLDRNEVCGYMVNEPGKETLTIKKPTWYQNILEKEAAGIPSVLFIDEISTAPDQVQGSLFNLISEREVNTGMPLPESTIIASAANFAQNLSQFFNIESPAINRFCIINLVEKNSTDFIDEYFQHKQDYTANWPKFTKVTAFDEALNDKCVDLFKYKWSEIIQSYSMTGDTSRGKIDFNNHDFASLYQNCAELTPNGEVYNFISPRTLTYHRDCVSAMVQLGISYKSSVVKKITEGLVGMGTNNFDNTKQIETFNKLVVKAVENVMSALKSGNAEEVEAKMLFNETDTVAEKCEKLSKSIDDAAFDEASFIKSMPKFINSLTISYPITTDEIHDKLNKLFGPAISKEERTVNLANFTADFTALKEFTLVCENLASTIVDAKSLVACVKTMYNICDTYKFYIEHQF